MGIILTGAGVSCPALMCLWYDDFIITGTKFFSSPLTPSLTYIPALKSWTDSLAGTSSWLNEFVLSAEGALHWNEASDVLSSRWWIEVGERRGGGEVWERTRTSAFSRRSQTLLHRLTDSFNQLDLRRLVMSDSQNCKLLQDRKRWAWNSDSIKPSRQSRARVCTWPAPVPDLETARFVLLCFFGQRLFFFPLPKAWGY